MILIQVEEFSDIPATKENKSVIIAEMLMVL